MLKYYSLTIAVYTANTYLAFQTRRNDLSDSELTNFIRFTYQHQVPTSFQIYPVHQEISSWVIYWLQTCKEMKASPKTQKTKSAEHGNVGMNTLGASDSMMMSGLPFSCLNNESKSWEPLPPHLEDDNFLSQTKKAWSLQQSKRPWQNWVRSLGHTWGTTPHME
jgi:hypothetical protein